VSYQVSRANALVPSGHVDVSLAALGLGTRVGSKFLTNAPPTEPQEPPHPGGTNPSSPSPNLRHVQAPTQTNKGLTSEPKTTIALANP